MESAQHHRDLFRLGLRFGLQPFTFFARFQVVMGGSCRNGEDPVLAGLGPLSRPAASPAKGELAALTPLCDCRPGEGRYPATRRCLPGDPELSAGALLWGGCSTMINTGSGPMTRWTFSCWRCTIAFIAKELVGRLASISSLLTRWIMSVLCSDRESKARR